MLVVLTKADLMASPAEVEEVRSHIDGFVGNDELTSGNFPLKNLVNGEQNTLDLEQIIVTVSS